MINTKAEALSFARESEAAYVRLGFCDPFGRQKDISIMQGELEAAFERGVAIDGSAIPGFCDVHRSDLLIFPDPSSLRVLPWRPGPGRVLRFYCDIRRPDGSPFSGDSRRLLKQAQERCLALGLTPRIGAECEFYLFETDERGEATKRPLDRGSYMDIAPLDRGEDIRREICLNLSQMGIQPETAHHEQGPGQNEIDFAFSDALSAADNLLTFQSVVRAIAARNGLFASFMPKPLEGEAGSGLHVNLSLEQEGENVFSGQREGHAALAAHFMAGILKRAPEITLFLNPLENSYERLGRSKAPAYVSWSRQNRSQLVRLPAAAGPRQRMELRSPDPSVNPYLAFALILTAGLEGIEQKMELPEPMDIDLFSAGAEVTDGLPRLPRSLEEAIALAEGSELVRSVLGKGFLNRYIRAKREQGGREEI